VITVLAIILGLLAGFYARQVRDKLDVLIEDHKDRSFAKQVGVVRPEVSRATRQQPIDLSSDTGVVRRPRPGEIEDARQDNRAKVLRENHSG
jgi:hypothetical protein